MSKTRVFFDTNVLLYLLSADTPKADQAEQTIAQGGVMSVQVLNECCSIASRTLLVRTLCLPLPATTPSTRWRLMGWTSVLTMA